MSRIQPILLASSNPGKLAELRRLCADLPVRILGPGDLPEGLPEVEETGRNFLENAVLKAFAAAAEAERQLGPGVWALADDSGLMVDALDGEPGVRSARFAGVEGPERDAANNALLLQRLEGLPPEARSARFVCVLAVARGDELLFAVEGVCEGRILETPAGAGGFGYDPLFYHEGLGSSFAEATPEQKAAVSHRGQAVERLRRVLEQVLPSSPAA